LPCRRRYEISPLELYAFVTMIIDDASAYDVAVFAPLQSQHQQNNNSQNDTSFFLPFSFIF